MADMVRLKTVFLILIGLLAAPALAKAPAMTEKRRAEHLKSFDIVWQKINDNHYDPKFGGIDWAAVKTELRPKIEAAQTDAEVTAVLEDMVGRLKLSHFGVYSPDAAPSDHAKEFFNFTPALAKDVRDQVVQFGNLPPLPLRYTYKKLPENVGYFYLSIFVDPPHVMAAFREGVDAARACDGMILDLRHNPGGVSIMAIGMGNAFVEKPDQKLGTMIERKGELNFVLNPQAEPYTKPLAILIDEHSGSTAEILAGGLKDLGRARIFGMRSAGMALPSVIEMLPNGDRFQYAVANNIGVAGKPLEGAGVEPDEKVEYAAPYKDPDPVVKAAVEWIQSQAKARK
jgi:C-terminal processing protease CtpA/Prc